MRAPRLLAAAALLLVSGCGLEKPSPIVTVVSGGNSVNSEAVSYCFEGQDREKEPGTEGACRFEEDRKPEVVRVQPGEQVGVDVEKDLADGNWIVVLMPQGGAPGEDGQPQEQASPVQDEHYFSFVPQFSGGAPLELQVRKLDSDQPDAGSTGVWRFVLAPR